MKFKTKKRKIGDLGEDLACLFLVKHGMRIIDRNYLKPWGEIDVVARSSRGVHFVEVKAVSRVTGNNVSRETINPEEHVTREKKERLSRAIQTYLADRHISHETSFQVDVITVKIDTIQKTALVEVFEKIM
ncbi:MAG: YraN family protein [Patescibacteria group bacterium]